MSAATGSSPRCRALLLELSRYLDGDLAPARRRAIERHLAACTCCGTMSIRMRTAIAACRAEGTQPPPRAVMVRAAKRVRALIAKSGITAGPR